MDRSVQRWPSVRGYLQQAQAKSGKPVSQGKELQLSPGLLTCAGLRKKQGCIEGPLLGAAKSSRNEFFWEAQEWKEQKTRQSRTRTNTMGFSAVASYFQLFNV